MHPHIMLKEIPLFFLFLSLNLWASSTLTEKGFLLKSKKKKVKIQGLKNVNYSHTNKHLHAHKVLYIHTCLEIKN